MAQSKISHIESRPDLTPSSLARLAAGLGPPLEAAVGRPLEAAVGRPLDAAVGAPLSEAAGGRPRSAAVGRPLGAAAEVAGGPPLGTPLRAAPRPSLGPPLGEIAFRVNRADVDCRCASVRTSAYRILSQVGPTVLQRFSAVGGSMVKPTRVAAPIVRRRW